MLPRDGGGLGRVLVGLGNGMDLWSLGALPRSLPAGTYRIETPLAARDADRAAL